MLGHDQRGSAEQTGVGADEPACLIRRTRLMDPGAHEHGQRLDRLTRRSIRENPARQLMPVRGKIDRDQVFGEPVGCHPRPIRRPRPTAGFGGMELMEPGRDRKAAIRILPDAVEQRHPANRGDRLRLVRSPAQRRGNHRRAQRGRLVGQTTGAGEPLPVVGLVSQNAVLDRHGPAAGMWAAALFQQRG